uniref:SLAIN motif-containing protein 2-like isoform X2 n=1 Tax=Myxine glutinosa TaxID=7769 RepID=UPI00358FD5DA
MSSVKFGLDEGVDAELEVLKLRELVSRLEKQNEVLRASGPTSTSPTGPLPLRPANQLPRDDVQDTLPVLKKPLSPGLKAGKEETTGNDAFDEVELVDIEENVDEEDGSWLYESPTRPASPSCRGACPLTWSRLAFASPVVPVGSGNWAPRPPLHGDVRGGSSLDSLSELSVSDGGGEGYRLQDLTDVEVLARMQEESLRQEARSLSSHHRQAASDTDCTSLDDSSSCCSLQQHHTPRSPPRIRRSALASPSGTIPNHSRRTRPPAVTRSNSQRTDGTTRQEKTTVNNRSHMGLPLPHTAIARGSGLPRASLRQPAVAGTTSAYRQKFSSVSQFSQSHGKESSPAPSTHTPPRSRGVATLESAGRSSLGGRRRLSSTDKVSKRTLQFSSVSSDDSWKDGCY